MNKPLVSLVIACYNEEAILAKSLESIDTYLHSLDIYNWEFILVDDGSKDRTPQILDEFAKNKEYVKVIHHLINLNLGNALKTGFKNSTGDYVITFDVDLSYSLDHIEKLLVTIGQTQADLILASPYMKGGKVTAVPFMRLFLSRFVNRIMSIASQEKFYTFTCMVRAYNGDFIRNLNLKTRDYEINSEIIYKSLILRARIIEIPAHLDWSYQNSLGKGRVSGMHIFKGIISGLMSSFIFRPYIYFIGVGTILLLISIYIISWIFINTFRMYPIITANGNFFDDRFSAAVQALFQLRPYSFLVGGVTLIVALQVLSTGFLSLQNKRYYEELFHLGSNLKETTRKRPNLK
jgi:glycosyltransferase involved in cell wall biosynthesis